MQAEHSAELLMHRGQSPDAMAQEFETDDR
jgi:hypothetical protein